MSQPSRVLISILAVLAAIALVAGVLHVPLMQAFSATPVFNAVILGVFLIGVAANLRQVLRLQREVNWIEAYRRSNPERTRQAYPDLKANQNMAQLTEELTSTENKVAFARQAYNDQVMSYNNKREVFPGNLVAGMFSFLPAALLEIGADEAHKREAPKVSFN